MSPMPQMLSLDFTTDILITHHLKISLCVNNIPTVAKDVNNQPLWSFSMKRTSCHGRQGFHSSRARDCYLPCQSCRSSSSCKVNRTVYHYSIQAACGRAVTVCKIFRSPAAFYCYRLAFLRLAFILIILCRLILLNERRK